MTTMRASGRAAIAALLAGACVAGAAPAAAEVGPADALLGNGRHLTPFGRMTPVGQFPTGGALTRDGRFYWAVGTGRGVNDVQILSLRTGAVVQTLRLPGASGGIVMDAKRSLAYVAGVHDSIDRADQETPDGTPGKDGDVIHVYSYAANGQATFVKLLKVPPQSGAPTPQNFPPTNSKKVAWPDRLAISADGAMLLVPLNLADSAAIVDSATGSVRYVPTGHYPYGAAILPGKRFGLVTNETPGTVSVIDLNAGKVVKTIQVGAHLSHPEGIALDTKGHRAFVAIANADEVSVIDTDSFEVEQTLSVARPEGIGSSPVDVTVTPDRSKLLVVEAGAEDIAVFRLPKLTLLGRIPTAEYPTDVAVAPRRANSCGTAKRTKRRCAKLVWLSGKGLGTGPNPNGPNPQSPSDSDNAIGSTQYLPLLNIGATGLADFPSDKTIHGRLSRQASAAIRPSNAQPAPADTPLRPDGPIKHVFYVVRENRTYDQILGDDSRGNGDPGLTLFGEQITPNAHALAKRFPLLDHVFANSEASIDGHFWTSAAAVSDYVHKAWFQNYGGRDRPYDFGVYAVSWPPNGFLFDQAERQGISWFNYGEAIAGTVGLFPDKDRTNDELARVLTKQSKSDLGTNGCYPNDASIGKDAILSAAGPRVEVFDTSPPLGAAPGSQSRFDCFRARFTAQDATNSVPAFNYMVLSNDHTEVLSAGARTPRAMIAENDEGLGRIVDLISHSSIWKSSAIFVVEDDSQDGADHLDAHRIPAFVISPYAKEGAVVSTRYDFLSFIRSMELVMGMRPLGLGDRLATPMYDAFQATPSNAPPYDAIPAKVDLLERNPASGPGARMSARMPTGLDQIPQREMDALLWKSVHGWKSKPPPPGPNAVAGAVDADG
jgi:DNA-binding beta-propeller fold protein YncE